MSVEVLIPKKNIVMDATLLSSLQGCGRFTDLRFNHRFVSMNGKSNSLDAGSVVHKGLEVFYKHKLNGFPRDTAIGAAIAAARLYADGCPYCADFTPKTEGELPQCGHQPGEYPGTQLPAESEDYKIGIKHTLETLEQYFEYYKNDYWVTLGVETVEGKILYTDDNIRILWKAKLDWKVDTNQGIYPVDHKTSKQRRPKIKLNNQFIGQCLVVGSRNMIVNEIGFQKSLKPAEKFIRTMMSYSADQLLEWQSKILPYWAYKLLEYTEDEYWPPNFTHCENKYGNCPFIDVCSTDENSREDAIRAQFIVGPEWNPTNPTAEE